MGQGALGNCGNSGQAGNAQCATYGTLNASDISNPSLRQNIFFYNQQIRILRIPLYTILN
jgi:hypothetical protein